MSVHHVSNDQFQKEVLDHKGVVLVDFFAEWCGPCKTMGPIINKLSDELKEIKFVKINVDENQDLASSYLVFSIPTFIFFKDGKAVSQFAGGRGKESFIEEIKKVTG